MPLSNESKKELQKRLDVLDQQISSVSKILTEASKRKNRADSEVSEITSRISELQRQKAAIQGDVNATGPNP